MQHLLHKIAGFGLNLWSLAAPQQATEAAIRLFATPPKPTVREKERAFLDTALQIKRRLAGQEIVEYHWGEADAPLVLLSYGWGYNAGRWRHFVPELLEAGYRVVAYDPPGHGLAPTGQLSIPLNAAIIQALVLEYGSLEAIVAHSFGGSSSVYALQDLPRYLHPRRMVIMASFSYAPRVFREYQQALGLWPSLYWRLVRNFEQRIGHPIEDFDFALMTADYPHIEGLLVHNPGDPVTPYAEARRYFDFWPGSRLYSPSEGGHHLGTAGITQSVLDFVVHGEAPAAAERQEQPVYAGHELVRHFVGM
ncbi:MAG TPA: alpha/beta fold hydrolase [Saprospiraceae bacterium]|nr:alpha/beta fold hydrolase [Saprospiraceae bacterium]